MSGRLVTDPDALERDAATLERSAFQLPRDEGRAFVQMAARLRRAAQAIRDGKIAGIPSR